MNRILNLEKLKAFFAMEASGGIVLFLAAIAALIVANSGFADVYTHIIVERHVGHWINDGLMAIFFFVVGLEIKREIKEGELSDFKSAMVPFIAAVFGVALPALIFYAINIDHPQNLRGAAIPTATDIAFSLGVLALLGSRAPFSLKILLTAIAIIDDLAAILIIAIFYTDDIDFMMIGAGVITVITMMLFNKFNIKGLAPYLALGCVLWVALLNSGIHPTMAGVLTAFCIPLFRKEGKEESWIDQLIHRLHPLTAFFILPVFAFANAGVNFDGVTLDHLTAPLTVGIIAGLVGGKAIGITGVLAIFRPAGVSLVQCLALGFLCGIGFTMSLFIGDLAFVSNELEKEVKIGVMVASVLSATLAALLLFLAPKDKTAEADQAS